MKEKKYIVQQTRDDRTSDEVVEHLNINARVKAVDMIKTDLRGACGKRRPVYAYIHGGMILSLKPFSCPWDSGLTGWIWTNRDSDAADFIDSLNAWLSGDYFMTYDREREWMMSGTLSECLEYLESEGVSLASVEIQYR